MTCSCVEGKEKCDCSLCSFGSYQGDLYDEQFPAIGTYLPLLIKFWGIVGALAFIAWTIYG